MSLPVSDVWRCICLREQKLNDLKEYIKSLGSLVVAYSGGVDSTFLLKVAHDILGDNLVAVTVKSLFNPQREFEEAIKYCKHIGAMHEVIVIDDISDIEGFSDNTVDRCYYCKKEIFKRISEVARKNNIKYIADGSNFDDLNDYRPGLKALKELNIISPLKIIKINKEDIRYYSKTLGLPTWDKPSFACFASRIPYGSVITKEKLETVDKAEQYLFDMGFKQIRVRHHGSIARIELGENDFDKFLDRKLMKEVSITLKKLGFSYVTLDLEGYRTGSMNEVINV